MSSRPRVGSGAPAVSQSDLSAIREMMAPSSPLNQFMTRVDPVQQQQPELYRAIDMAQQGGQLPGSPVASADLFRQMTAIPQYGMMADAQWRAMANQPPPVSQNPFARAPLTPTFGGQGGMVGVGQGGAIRGGGMSGGMMDARLRGLIDPDLDRRLGRFTQR